jgi:hypothetical protein
MERVMARRCGRSGTKRWNWKRSGETKTVCPTWMLQRKIGKRK